MAKTCSGAPPAGLPLTYGFIERVIGGHSAGGPLLDASTIYLSKKAADPSKIQVYCKATDTKGREEWVIGQKSFGLHTVSIGYTENIGRDPDAAGQRYDVDDSHRPAGTVAEVKAVVWSDERHGKVFTIQIVAYLPEGSVIKTNLPGEAVVDR